MTPEEYRDSVKTTERIVMDEPKEPTMSDIWVCSRWNTAPKDEEKFLVQREGPTWYSVIIDKEVFCLPMAHYIPCPAPEQWERVELEVTKLDEPTGTQSLICHYPQGPIGYVQFSDKGYRVVSLVVERRNG